MTSGEKAALVTGAHVWVPVVGWNGEKSVALEVNAFVLHVQDDGIGVAFKNPFTGERVHRVFHTREVKA